MLYADIAILIACILAQIAALLFGLTVKLIAGVATTTKTARPRKTKIAIRNFIVILSNVEVTGDPLEAACGAGMFVI